MLMEPSLINDRHLINPDSTKISLGMHLHTGSRVDFSISILTSDLPFDDDAKNANDKELAFRLFFFKVFFFLLKIFFVLFIK